MSAAGYWADALGLGSASRWNKRAWVGGWANTQRIERTVGVPISQDWKEKFSFFRQSSAINFARLVSWSLHPMRGSKSEVRNGGCRSLLCPKRVIVSVLFFFIVWKEKKKKNKTGTLPFVCACVYRRGSVNWSLADDIHRPSQTLTYSWRHKRLKTTPCATRKDLHFYICYKLIDRLNWIYLSHSHQFITESIPHYIIIIQRAFNLPI